MFPPVLKRLCDGLSFPDHFPPTDRWRKFFMGVRWLGPDLSFFQVLARVQGDRVPSQMADWQGGMRARLAEHIGETLRRSLG